jgi:hypothetical protein
MIASKQSSLKMYHFRGAAGEAAAAAASTVFDP